MLSLCLVLFGFAGCNSHFNDIAKTAILYTNMEAGSESPDVKQHEWVYSGDLTAEKLAEGLSKITGLDFKISVTALDDGLSVDWKGDSTLIANLDDRTQKDKFHFFDADGMRWFMMDSLWLTLTKNLDAKNIYYTTAGGKELSFEELNPVNTFPSDLPYMGSAFFFAHADGKGELQDGRGDLIEEEDGRGDLIVMSQVEAEEIVWEIMTEEQKEGLSLVGGGEDTINGEHAIIVIVGNKSADGQKFTEVHHHAVTDSGAIFQREPVWGAEWIPLPVNQRR